MLLLQNPGQGKAFFLSTTRYKLIKCGLLCTQHSIQNKTEHLWCASMSKYAKEVEDRFQKAPHSWEVRVARISSENILIPTLYICFIILRFFLIMVLIVFCSHRPTGHKYFINWSILFDSSYISLSQTWWGEHFFWWIVPVMGFNQPGLLKRHESASVVICYYFCLYFKPSVKHGKCWLRLTVCGDAARYRGERWLTFILQGPSGPVQEKDTHPGMSRDELWRSVLRTQRRHCQSVALHGFSKAMA